MKNNILICVTGLTPQIVTETLFCLAVQKKIKIDQLFIITTARGRDIISGKDNEYNKQRGYPSLKIQLKKLSRQYKIKHPFFNDNDNIIVAREMAADLYDVRNDRHNLLFPNKVCEIIKEKTNDQKNVLHCSISGGRKTMSVDMAFALTLFGREDDKLYHVLVNETLEFNKDFWFPRDKKEKKLIEISELPLVKLRSLLGDFTKNKIFNELSYTDLVELMQQQLRIKTSDKLYIDWRKKWIWYGDNEPENLEPKLIQLYRYLHSKKMEGQKSLYIKDLAHQLYNNYDTKNVLSLITRLNNKIVKVIKDQSLVEVFKISSPKKLGTGQYGILADTEKIIFID